MSDSVTAVTDAVAELEAQLPALLEQCTDPEATDMAELLDAVRAAGKRLRGVELDTENATARAMMGEYAETATLRVERSRATDRKAWDHESWQRDVRAKLLRSVGLAGAQGIVDAEGELLPASVLHELLAGAQGAHGSTAPRTTTLRKLGLDARDYCESTPGTYRVKVTRMADEHADDQAEQGDQADHQAVA